MSTKLAEGLFGMLRPRRTGSKSHVRAEEAVPRLVDQLASAELEQVQRSHQLGSPSSPVSKPESEAALLVITTVMYSPDELPRVLGFAYQQEGLRAMPRLVPVCSFWRDTMVTVVRRCGGLRLWGGIGPMAPCFGVMGPTYPLVVSPTCVAVGDVGPIKTHGETRSGRIKLLTPHGEPQRSVGVDYPRGMATDGTHLFVINSLRDTLQKLRLSDGAMVEVAQGDGRMFGAEGVAYSDGVVFVSDVGRGRIGVFDTQPALKWRQAYGSPGQSKPGQPAAGGQFQRPTGIATHGLELFVADTSNHRIQVLLTVDGHFLRAFGGTGPGERGEGERAGEFRLPRGVAVDPTGAKLFVAEQKRVQVLTTQFGVPLQVLPIPGAGTLWGISVGPQYAHVVDNFKQRVTVLKVCNEGVSW